MHSEPEANEANDASEASASREVIAGPEARVPSAGASAPAASPPPSLPATASLASAPAAPEHPELAGPGDAGPSDVGPSDVGPGDAGPGDAGPTPGPEGDRGPPAVDAPIRRVMDAVRPALDPYVREVMRAQVAQALFGAAPPAPEVGRYQLRRELGTGGGGSVFEAWDPELAREVAIKLVHAPEPSRRARALAEGQALAKLAHPNVVPVFDVGVLDDRLYLVMERVRGESLRSYAARHRPRQILAAFRQCCEGLATAHAAKLVHRDFKPDNAMVGADGRARLIDFGLALEDARALDGAAGGTPRYMAPEQRRGEPLTAAADQYAFAVSLREALGQVPAWLERVLARAEAEQPAARFPSMRELGAALARDPRTVWRRRALVAVPIALGVAGFWAGRAADQPPSCDGAAELLAPAWSPARRQQISAHLSGLGTRYAALVAPQLTSGLDAYAARWREAHRQGCRAHQRGELTATAYDQRQACLSGSRTQLSTLTELATTAEAAQLGELVQALPELSDPAQCAEAVAVGVAPPPRERASEVARVETLLGQVRVRVLTRGPGVERELETLVRAASAVGYPPLLARAQLLRGSWFVTNGPFAESLEPLRVAADQALRSRDYPTAVEAFARRAWALSKRASAEDSLAGVAQMVALAAGLPAVGRFAEALLHNNLGSINLTFGRVSEARAELEQALELARTVTGPGAIELSNTLANLALVTDDDAQRTALFERWVAGLRAALGESHPAVFKARIMAAIESGSESQGRAELRAACGAMAELHPWQHTELADCMFELGWLELMDGAEDAADVALRRSAQERPAAERSRLALAYLALRAGEVERGRSELRALRSELERPGRPWFQAMTLAQVDLVEAYLAHRANDPGRAARALASARSTLEAAAKVHRSRSILRRQAWSERLARSWGVKTD